MDETLQKIRRAYAQAGRDQPAEYPPFHRITSGPAIVDLYVAAIDPAQLLQPLQERREVSLHARTIRDV